MPSFAELKAKASGVTNSGVEKFQNVRDKNSSVPMKKTNWDPYSGQPAPPPPPPQSIVNRKTKPVLEPLPPPPSRTSSAATSSVSRQNSSSPGPPLPTRGPSSSPAPQLPSRSKGSAPPPPPSRSSASKPLPAALPRPNKIGPPPPISRSTRPGARVTPVASTTNDDENVIDWANLTPEDKQVFFSWLDEFFGNFKRPTPGGAGSSGKIPDTGAIEHNIAPPSHAPPPLRSATKPPSWNRPQAGTSPTPSSNRADFVLSHPPASKHGSSALDMAYYFAPATRWTEMWFNPPSGAPMPPPLVGDTNHTYTSSWVSRGSNKTTNVGITFSDLSIFWGSVQFTTTSHDPNQNTRDAVYLGRPRPLGREALVEAHEIYGDTIALFAESFLGSGQYCARGECWDLANEALKYFKDYDYIPKPIPSISRTHGHLIYEGKASQGGREMAGRWRGGDDRIRRGDIVEWRRVKIGVKGAPPGSFYTLGDPDHTAIIVADSVPSQNPTDGAYLSPVDLGVIVVVEQSLGHPPKKTEYHLSCLQEGEMWIYRPIGMLAYLGVADITATPPDELHGLQRL